MVDWQLIVLLVVASVLALATGILAVAVLRLRRRPSLAEGLQDGLLVLDPDDRVVQLNQAAETALDLPEPAVGKPLTTLIPEAEPLLVGAENGDRACQDIVRGEGENRRAYELQIVSRHDRRGQLIGRLATLRDVTSAREQEASLLAQNERHEQLASVVHAVAEPPNVQETLRSSLKIAAGLTGAESGSLFLLDPSGSVTHSVVALGKTLLEERQIVRRVLDRGLAGWVVRNREPALIDDTQDDDRWLPSQDGKYSARSALALPVLKEESLVGVLTLTHSEPERFREEHVGLMQAAVAEMAFAMRTAQRFDEQRQLAEHWNTLYEVLRTVGNHLDPEAVVHAAVEAIRRLTDWPAVAIMLPTTHGADFIVQGATGLLAESEGQIVPATAGIVGRAMKLGEPQSTPDVEADADYRPLHPDIRSELAVPLRRGERLMGALDVQSDLPEAFSQSDLHLARLLADAVALALDNARFHSAMRKHATDLNALYTINRMIGRSLVLEDMLSKALYSALTSMGYGFGLISLVDPADGHLTLAATRGLPTEMSDELQRKRLIGSFPAYVHSRNEAVAIGDVDQDGPEVRRLQIESPDVLARLRELEVRACVGIPLQHQRHSLGILCMFSRHPRSFLADDLDLQMSIGQQIAMAVTNLRLFRTIDDERSLLQALIESSRDGIIMIGARQQILVINQPALDFLRLPGRPDVWVNRSATHALLALRHNAPGVVRTAIDEIRRVAKRSKLSGEGEFELPPRTIRWLNLPVMAGASTLGRLLVLHDVTDERMVDRVREDLIHTMVHDLRNPLTSIFGSMEFLSHEIAEMLSVNQQQVLDIALTNSQQMVEMVNAILDISRLESGRMPLDQTPIALPILVNKVLRSQLPLAGRKQLKLESQVPGDLPLAWADANLFERVLQNLVGNAIKFTPTGGHISVQATAETLGRPRIVVSVKDTGPGISTEVEGRIFQKFATGRHAKSGSGLGLAFCKMVVEAHGGRIWVDSQPGEGATFKFTLPRLPATSTPLTE